MRRTNLRGHALQSEGAPYRRDGDGQWERVFSGSITSSAGTGHGLCECGESSGELLSTRARKAWHREHKEDVRLRAVARAPCGTYAALMRHRRLREPPDDDCLRAGREYTRVRRDEPGARAMDRWWTGTRRRALERLGGEYPDRLAELVAEERRDTDCYDGDDGG